MIVQELSSLVEVCALRVLLIGFSTGTKYSINTSGLVDSQFAINLQAIISMWVYLPQVAMLCTCSNMSLAVGWDVKTSTLMFDHPIPQLNIQILLLLLILNLIHGTVYYMYVTFLLSKYSFMNLFPFSLKFTFHSFTVNLIYFVHLQLSQTNPFSLSPNMLSNLAQNTVLNTNQKLVVIGKTGVFPGVYHTI